MAELPSPRDVSHEQLRRILAALQDGVILIEPDQSISWANGAALRMHGVTEIAQLGASVSDYRARFELRHRNHRRLPEGQHPMERVLAGEAFDEVVVDVAPAGQNEARWTHRIRSLILTDRAGIPDCLVLILDDETERFEAEDRFEATFAANPAPAVILRLSDHRHIKVNRGFLEMTGYREEEVVGRSALAIDVLEGAARREFAIERLQQGRTIPQMEAVLQLPRGGEKRVVVAGQPIEVADADCMLFTFVDLEHHKLTEAALRMSEDSFAASLRLAPVPMFVASRAGCRLVLVNEAFTRETGHAGAEVIGRAAGELRLWAEPSAGEALEQRLESDGRVRDLMLRLRTSDDCLLECLVAAEPVVIGGEACVLVVAQEISEHRRAEAEVAAAIEAVMQDTAWFTQAVLEKLARLRRPDVPGTASAAELGNLSARGRDVLTLVCRGMPDTGIARKLGISRNTVRNHVTALFQRTGVRSRAALVVWARERGFTGGPPRKSPHPKKTPL